MRLHSTVICGLILGLTACSWVTLTPSGEKARVLDPEDVVHCRKVGATTVTTRAQVANVYRSQGKVAEELQILARNAAADLGGDTVVPQGPAVDGKQTFDVYKCLP